MRTPLFLLNGLLICLLVTSVWTSSDEDESELKIDEEGGGGGGDGVPPDLEETNDEDAGDSNQALPVDYDYKTPTIESDDFYLFEHFDSENDFAKKWIKSQSTKAGSDEYKYDGQWELTESSSRFKGDLSLVMKNKARHHAIGSKLRSKIDFSGQNLVVQYEVQFKDGQECGGAYLKLLAAPSGDLSQLNDKTPYSIMFGPDKCGNDYKLHFIFMHKHPLNGTLREIHWEKASSADKIDGVFKDKKWHLFRLTIRPDNSFEIQMDKRKVGDGSLLTNFNPPVNPPKEIDDPNDSKPEDWDEREKIADPEAVKPEDWDENEPRKIPDPNAVKPADWLEEEPENIPDPEATKPADWDPEMDGEWEPPLVTNPKCAKVSGCGQWKAPLMDNPKYRGKWKPPLISNPNYKGKWAPRKIPNPDFFEDKHPYKMLPIDSVAFELWTMSADIGFDNILVTSNVDVANYVADVTYQIKRDLSDAETDNWIVKMIKYTNKNPWMWVVYLLAIAIPVILFIGYCCVTPGKGSSTSARSNDELNSSRQSTTEQMADEEDEAAKFGISGDEPTPLNPNELSRERSGGPDAVEEVNEQDNSTKVPSEGEEGEEDAQVGEETEDGNADSGSSEAESKPRLRKARARKEN